MSCKSATSAVWIILVVGLVVGAGAWLSGVPWRDKALTIHNVTAEQVSVLRLSDNDQHRMKLEADESAVIVFSRGESFQVGAFVDPGSGYPEFDYEGSDVIQPSCDVSIEIVRDQSGQLRFVLVADDY